MDLINQTLQQYLDAIDRGFGLIGGNVRWVFNTLVVINLVLAALFWMLSDEQVIAQLVRKILFIGVFAWIIENWADLTDALASTFMLLGVKAGGGQFTPDVVLNPAAIADRGLGSVSPMMQAIRDLSGPVGFFENFPEILLLALAVLAVLIAFFSIAIQAVMTLLTFKLGTLAAFVLLPFSLISHTAFMAERPLGWVVSASLRLMILTLVVGLGEQTFAQLQIEPAALTVRSALGIAVAALTLMILALTASRLASDLATGTPRLGALDAGVAVGGTVVASSYVAGQVVGAGRQVARGSRLAAVKAASALGSLNSKRSAGEAS